MNTRRTALLIFFLALACRMAMLFATFHGNGTVPYYDDAKIAINLVEGRGYSIDFGYRNWLLYESLMKQGQLDDPIIEGVKPTASKQPVYPLVLATIFSLFGVRNFLAVFLFQALLSALTASLLFVAFRGQSFRTALIGAAAATVYPAFVFHSVTAPESTTTGMLLVSLLFCWFSWMNASRGFGSWALLGALAALLALTDPVTLPFAVLSVGYAFYLYRPPLKHLHGLAVTMLVFFTVMTPWLTRNYIVFDRFPVIKSVLGTTFDFGLERSGRGSWISDARLASLEYDGRYKSELEEDEAIRSELLSLFPTHWREYVTFNIPTNFVHFWWEVPRYADNGSMSYRVGRQLPYVLLLILALPTMFWLIWRVATATRQTLIESPLYVCGLVLIVTFTAIYTVFGAYMSRYRLPVELCLIPMAARTLTFLASRLSSPQQAIAS